MTQRYEAICFDMDNTLIKGVNKEDYWHLLHINYGRGAGALKENYQNYLLGNLSAED